MTEERKLGDALEFLSVLWATSHALEMRSLRMQRDLGVSWPQRLVLRIVGRFSDITPTALADILCLHRSTLSPQLKRLETRGLIARRVDTKDRRRVFLSLTDEGKRLDSPGPATIEAEVESLLSEVPATDVVLTKRVLTEFAKRLAL